VDEDDSSSVADTLGSAGPWGARAQEKTPNIYNRSVAEPPAEVCLAESDISSHVKTFLNHILCLDSCSGRI